MARRYRVTFEAVAVSAAQDLIQLKGAAGKMLLVRRFWVGATDTTAPTNQQLSLRARYLPATVSDGSGGSTPTPQKTDPGDAAASATALANDTTKATTGGTAVILYENGVNIYAGDDQRRALDEAYPIGPSESFVWELLSSASGTVHLSGGVEFDEIGG